MGPVAFQPPAGRTFPAPARLIRSSTRQLLSDISSDASLPELPPGLGEGEGIDRRRVADLIAEIKLSADKLATDRTSRGDLKILSRALRELRYAFKVFTPYRTRRKVTVFGSARTRPSDPSYPQAVAFGHAMAQLG